MNIIKLNTNQKLTNIIVECRTLETLEPDNKTKHCKKYLPFNWIFNLPTCEISNHEFGYISSVILLDISERLSTI